MGVPNAYAEITGYNNEGLQTRYSSIICDDRHIAVYGCTACMSYKFSHVFAVVTMVTVCGGSHQNKITIRKVFKRNIEYFRYNELNRYFKTNLTNYYYFMECVPICVILHTEENSVFELDRFNKNYVQVNLYNFPFYPSFIHIDSILYMFKMYQNSMTNYKSYIVLSIYLTLYVYSYLQIYKYIVIVILRSNIETNQCMTAPSYSSNNI
ncbi:hypothetical protein AGLY_004702 [Aphis glycines]|uniref:Uncharacterized protein n=1 Tax=Aphis glycines TaxID=307491 RepID=A0A6G0TV50_APHGL|nr:hypothetical protein AGLY_004702 [Aphis glycines]